VSDAPPLRYRLHSPDLLRTLMQRTGDGSSITVRGLAKAAGCHASYISELMNGQQETASADIAEGTANRIGVDVLVLWQPAQRTDKALRLARADEQKVGAA
jgi:transcriptional regulator with XRE-family HTH domain